MNGPANLSWVDLALASSLVLLNGAISGWLGLGLGRQLMIASVRTVVQLLILGYVLVRVFLWESPWGVLAIGLAMIVMAGREGIRRTGRRYRGIQLDAFLSLAVAGGATALLATAVIVGADPWWKAQYLIPLLGMVLGNALTGIGLGLERCMSQFDDGRARVEFMLALGATRWEAARPVAGEAVRAGLVPILNSMSVVGLVTIPGMMTGQILGGVSPMLAARYQILIMFLIAAATAAGTTGVVLLCVRALFDSQHRLRLERLVGRARGA